jgi:hypothetical protein
VDPHLQVTQSSSTIYALRMHVKGPFPDPHPNAHTVRIGGMGIPTKTVFLWVADGPDAASSLEQWDHECLHQTEITGASGEYKIEQATKRIISVKSTYLPTVRDLLQQSMTLLKRSWIVKGLWKGNGFHWMTICLCSFLLPARDVERSRSGL